MRRNTIIPLVFVCSLRFGAVASAQTLPVVIPQTPDPLLQNLTIPADAHIKGMWSANYPWDLIAMHSAVMPDGRVVTFGSPVGVNMIKAEIFDVWTPSRGFTAAAHRKLANIPSVDSFCSASVLLKTGELLTSGGNKGAWDQNVTANNGTSLLNTATNSAPASWSMASPRYYATTTTLADSRILITGGTWAGGPATFTFDKSPSDSDYQTLVNMMSGPPEVYTPGVGWSTLTGAPSLSSTGGPDAFGPQDNRWWYPRQWVARNEMVFGLSAHQMWYLDPNGNGGTGKINLVGTFKSGVGTASKPNVGATSTAVMFDVGKILQVGGNGRMNGWTSPDFIRDWTDSSPYATIIDINNAPDFPVITETAQLPDGIGRQWANATVLPDGRVVVTGGTRLGNSNNSSDVVKQAAIWNPAAPLATAWTAGASASEVRVYHSTAVLLPNGTVLTAGSGGPPGWSPMNPGRFNAEVYYPPYLFQAGAALASRPKILSMNNRKFSHGGPIQAEVSAGQMITKAVLIGLGSATHGFDMGQRLYPFPTPISQTGSIVSFVVPGPNLVPPGYYYLFVTNQSGVPSEGVILAIGFDVVRPPTDSYARIHGTKFDVDGDGKTDLGIWRPDEVASKWYIVKSMNGGAVTPEPEFGNITNGVQDIPVPADYDGDGKTDLAYWRPILFAEWHIKRSSDNAEQTIQYGANNNNPGSDIPVPGDYDGDGKTDLAVWRPHNFAEWYIMGSKDNASVMIQFGAVNNGVADVPVPADYDGDGKTDLAVWRPGTGNNADCTAPDKAGCWWIRRSSDLGWTVQAWGGISNGVQDIPVPADYDGDGKTDIAIWRPGPGNNTNCMASDRAGCWWISRSSDLGSTIHPWGGIINGVQDIPVPSDYDGDGKADMTIFRPKNFPEKSTWWVLPTGGGPIWWSALGGPNPYPWGTIYKGVSDLPMTARH